jgi:hypothetical protein
VAAIVAFVIFMATIVRIAPPRRRRGLLRGRLFWAALLFVIPAATKSDARGILFFGGVLFLLCAIPLFWYGPMPADMPLATDPDAGQHPRYAEFVRRGKIAGAVIVAFLIIVIALGAVFVNLG